MLYSTYTEFYKKIDNFLDDLTIIFAFIIALLCGAFLIWVLTRYRRNKKLTIIQSVPCENSESKDIVFEESNYQYENKQNSGNIHTKSEHKNFNKSTIRSFIKNKKRLLIGLAIVIMMLVMIAPIISVIPILAIFIPIINYSLSFDIKELKLMNRFIFIPSVIVAIIMLLYYPKIVNNGYACTSLIVILVFCGILLVGMCIAERNKIKRVDNVKSISENPYNNSFWLLIVSIWITIAIYIFLFVILVALKFH